MASAILYSPTVNTYLPAFVTGDSSICRFYFSLSKYSSSPVSSIKQVHVSVVKQTSGQSVVNRTDSTQGRYRATGIIIINSAPTKVIDKENLYYIDILNEDIKSGDSIGWQAGWVYKVQIRLSTVNYNSNEMGQAAWLNANAEKFSEWSTYCTIKATGKPKITIPILKDYDSSAGVNLESKIFVLDLSTLKFEGTYYNSDESETLYSYRVQLFDDENNLLEDSDILYTNQYYNPNQFYYLFKTELKDSHRYGLSLEYTTINKYEESFLFNLQINQAYSEEIVVYATTIDSVKYTKDDVFIKEMNQLTSKVLEEDEGKILLKLYSENLYPVMANICIRRADSKDNFQTWSDIKIINCVNKIVNDLDPIEDFTIESGVWYKYGVQIIESSGYRNLLYVINGDSGSLREFEYSFLLGTNNKQLKLKYNNNVSGYTYNYLESKADTLGGEYPFITRNGATKYRSFPITGLISYTMDENEQFTNDKELYKYPAIIQRYKNRRIEEGFGIYDYKKEFDFREEVLKFLYDGKPKLFKSSTEGNIIVRLMQVSAQPNQSLNRMIFSFSATAYEIAEATIENYNKYNFLDIGDYLTSFNDVVPHRGQIIFNEGFPVNQDLIYNIWHNAEFNPEEEEMAGYKISLKYIKNLMLTFGDSDTENPNPYSSPLKIKNRIGDETFGNNFQYNKASSANSALITVERGSNSQVSYVFDDNLTLTESNNIIILGDIDSSIDKVYLIADFDYFQTIELADKRKVDSRESIKNIGQIYDFLEAGTNIYKEIALKYYYKEKYVIKYLYRLTAMCIESEPGLVFEITNKGDTQRYIINETGILNFSDYDNNIKGFTYLGKSRNGGTENEDIDPINAHVSVNYLYYMTIINYNVL